MGDDTPTTLKDRTNMLSMKLVTVFIVSLSCSFSFIGAHAQTNGSRSSDSEPKDALCSAPMRCKTNHSVVGECFKVRGRMNYWNGTPSTRIWIVGTHRMLGLPCEDFGLPEDVRAHFSDFDDEVTGLFEVCPVSTYRKGAMQMVCVESVSGPKFGRANR